ncbi:FecCD family ABC transporter permease [Anaeromicrobium sediminis]|uniref:Iron ABC transporter permease n=1 Tax=Anaeromicrobium sediminis TaxID=1478221 RepID=A0A267MBA7_9FIRM|nr:iron ABC transporter permease [Anaeromicrobium sediminis]PAB56208.1 iron ABC transporter permease [Anaeromicrobium sediminis]
MKIFEKKLYFTILCITLSVGLIASIIASISLGPITLDFKEVWKIIASKLFFKEIFQCTWKKTTESIVWNLRFPRTLLAIIAGAGLSLCGIMMQALTKNPLANPYILGISSGASTGAVMIIIFGGSSIFGIQNVSIGAFIGALLASLLVFILSRQNGVFSSTRLVLTGVSIAALFSSITSFLIFTAQDYSKVHEALFWMTGSLGGAKWGNLLWPSAWLLISYVFLIIFSRGLNSLLLGEGVAITLGVDTKFLKNMILCLGSILTGFVVSITGVIGFVGLIVPHICRTLVGADHKRVSTLSLLLGPILLIWADILARMIARPEEIPIGVITALLGAPFFIWLIRKSSYSFGGKNG